MNKGNHENRTESGLRAEALDRAARRVVERLTEPALAFDADFENGTLDRAVRLGPDWYQLELRPDTWYRFHFRVRGCQGREVCFEFSCRNVSNSGYDEGKDRWFSSRTGELIKPLVSTDGRNWQPVASIEKHPHDIGKYRFYHAFTEDVAYFCHHHPYTYSDMLSWLKPLLTHPHLRCDSLGATRNGFVQPVLTVTENPDAKDLVVLIGREDADEQVGSWGIEGMLQALLSEAMRPLRQRYTFKIVPMVAIDGVVAGAHYSAGYGYGGWNWHLDPSPKEIENVKNGIRQWVAGGYRLRLAGKVHSPPFFTENVVYDGILTASPRLQAAIEQGVAQFSQGQIQPRDEKHPAIRPKGYFERFVFDEFELYDVFATHLFGASPAHAHNAGVALMHGISAGLDIS